MNLINLVEDDEKMQEEEECVMCGQKSGEVMNFHGVGFLHVACHEKMNKSFQLKLLFESINRNTNAESFWQEIIGGGFDHSEVINQIMDMDKIGWQLLGDFCGVSKGSSMGSVDACFFKSQ